MSLLTRISVAWVIIVILAVASDASAWVTLEVRADHASVDIQPDGLAVVEHDILLRVRGGPLKELTFSGVDKNTTLVGDPTIVRARAGRAAGFPIPLTYEAEADSVNLAITYKKGVSSGFYLVHFSYQTHLGEAGLIQRGPDGVQVAWDGLIFADGIDSMSTDFILPRGALPPALPSGDAKDGIGLAASTDGVFLSELRREAERDILTVTRPHVAKQERVRWTIQVSPELLTFGLGNSESESAAQPALPALGNTTAQSRSSWHFYLLLSTLLGLTFCALVALKRRWLLGVTARSGARIRFLVPAPGWLRYPLLFALPASGVAIALAFERPNWAALVWAFGLLLAVQVPMLGEPGARGPGRWQIVELEPGLWKDVGVPLGFGRVLDASSVLGFVFFSVSIAGLSVAALRLLGTAPYQSASIFAASSALVPIFFTLGSLSGAQSFLALQKSTLRPIAERLLAVKQAVKLTGRVADSSGQVDEYRLILPARRVIPGLGSVEIAVEVGHSLLTQMGEPVIIVKVSERTVAHLALLALLRDEPVLFSSCSQWSRGRSSDERVLLVRPRIPSAAMCVDTCKHLVIALHRAAKTSRRSPVARRTSSPASKNQPRVPARRLRAG